MAFLTENLPILLCAVFGIGLLIAEAFIPGFGVAGIAGIALEIAAIVLTMLYHGVGAAIVTALVLVLLCALAVWLALRSAAKGRLSKSGVILNETEQAQPAADGLARYQGAVGTALTALRPAGTADFGGTRLNVVSDGEYISAGQKIRILRCEGGRLVARAVNENEPE